MSIFKPCDIRGIYNQELTEKGAYNLGRAAGTLAAGEKALVAGDVRVSTPSLKSALAEGLVSAGCQVTDMGILTTPIFYLAAHRTANNLAIMVTASHNPPEYNGFKLLLHRKSITEEQIKLLQEIVVKKDFTGGQGSYRQDNAWLDRYRQELLQRFRPGHLKIVLDCGNGSCSLIAPELFQTLGYQVEELYCTPDGRFPNRLPNPAVTANIAVLCQRVADSDAAVGIAYDGDGDRVVFVDETGQPLANDRVLALFARHLLAREKGAVVYDSKCSLVVAEEVARLGGTPLLARSGHGFVGSAFLAHNALVAGELSGHFFWRDLQFDDGIYSSLVLLELLRTNPSLALMNKALPRYLITPDIRLPFAGDPAALINQAAQKLAAYPVSRVDGIRLQFTDCWGMIRPSITEPIITLRFEGKTPARLAYIEELMLAVLPDQIQDQAEAVLQSLS